jgi:hypothetical protein
MALKEKMIWFRGATVLSLLLTIIVGGFYIVTPPSEPVNEAFTAQTPTRTAPLANVK